MRYGWEQEQRRRVPPPIHSSIYTYSSKVGVSVTHSKRRGKGRSVEGELKQRIIITEGASGRYFDSTLKAVPLTHSLACVVLCVSVRTTLTVVRPALQVRYNIHSFVYIKTAASLNLFKYIFDG